MKNVNGTNSMASMLEELRTPIKTNRLILKPSYKRGEFDSHFVDGPTFPFYHEGRYYMGYIGFDSIGYQTALASSTDLLNWEKEGIILARGPSGSATEFDVHLDNIVRDNELYGSGTLKKVNGRFLGTYNSTPQPGFERGPGVIGLCYSDDLRNWEVGDPILRPEGGADWEAAGLYKPWLMEHEGIYYIFYNAKNHDQHPYKREQIGVATSQDLIHWERYPDSPVVRVGPEGSIDSKFAADPVVLRHRDQWLMFYYSLDDFWVARDTVAFSDDLLNWEKSNEVLIDVGEPGSIDSRYAHKPGIIAKDGRLFHFYCAVSSVDPESPSTTTKMGEIRWHEVRGISVAHS